ncbi:MAG: FG-GAP-like repeat-containing protein [Vicinamibacteria bacterium]
MHQTTRFVRALALITLLAGPSVSSPQTPPSPAPTPAATLSAAIGRMQANDLEGALGILDRVVALEPGNGRAWRILGTARHRHKDFDQAIEAFHHSLEVEPSMPTPLYSLGLAYAAKKDADHAFEWLQKARASHQIDMTPMEGAGELASIKDDPRFKALLPTPKDFEDPFVEPVKIIREWDGEASNDQFGWIARNIGDVDGDGVNDIVTSAPTKDVGGANAGRVYVYSSKTGKLLWSADGRPGDQFGNGIEAAGDTNHDGIPDVIAGAPGGGYARIFSGRDGRLLHTFMAEDKNDQFGQHTDGVGDVDHDGFADVIVGAPGNSAGGAGAGRAYIYSGKTGRVLLTLTGERAGDGLGAAVGGSSDKAFTFLLVGAPQAGARRSGQTFVYRGLHSKPDFVIDSDGTGTALGGMFVSVPGDVDGDGIPDVYASDWNNTAKGPSTGRIYVHSGRDGKRLLTLTGETAGEGFGTSPSVAGDVDGDGHADLIVGAWQYAGAATGAGRAYLYSGKDGRLMKAFTCKTPGDAFGFDAVTLGDVDGDGMADFLITSAWSGIHGFHSGRVFIISSGVKRGR